MKSENIKYQDEKTRDELDRVFGVQVQIGTWLTLLLSIFYDFIKLCLPDDWWFRNVVGVAIGILAVVLFCIVICFKSTSVFQKISMNKKWNNVMNLMSACAVILFSVEKVCTDNITIGIVLGVIFIVLVYFSFSLRNKKRSTRNNLDI